MTGSSSTTTEVSSSTQRVCHFTVVDSLLNLMHSEVPSAISHPSYVHTCIHISMSSYLLLCPSIAGVEYCDQFVYLYVCLSVCEHVYGTAGPTLICTVVLVQSSGSIVICYVFPVLWMTSRLQCCNIVAESHVYERLFFNCLTHRT